MFYRVHGVVPDINADIGNPHLLLLAYLVLEEQDISTDMSLHMPVEGVPVGGDDLALETGVHCVGGDRRKDWV